VLHVGSTIPRKRIDVLLEVFAAVRRAHPDARLVRAGGRFTPEQEQQARDLGVLDAVVTLPFCSRATLAAVYRRAAIVVQPSSREGFGLPIVEAMACGTPVIASDIPALREVGGDAAAFCAVGDVNGWTETLASLLEERQAHPDRWSARKARGCARARSFSWSAFAEGLSRVYEELGAGAQPAHGTVRCRA